MRLRKIFDSSQPLSFQEEIAGLNSELQLMRDLLTKAEKRAEHAATEREKVNDWRSQRVH